MSGTLDWELEYRRRGWATVPVPAGLKRPIITGWNTTAFQPDAFAGDNIAIVLGARSGWLTDIDLGADQDWFPRHHPKRQSRGHQGAHGKRRTVKSAGGLPLHAQKSPPLARPATDTDAVLGPLWADAYPDQAGKLRR
jgi:hypothetical protein